MKQQRKKTANVKKVATDKLSMAEKTLSNPQYISAKNDFLTLFTLCEITCKTIIVNYKKLQKEKIDVKNIKLDMRTIPHAMQTFNINIDKRILTKIFSANEQRGNKSAKKLRDGIIHALNTEDISEVISRQKELYDVMNTYLSFFKPPKSDNTDFEQNKEYQKN